MSLKDELSRLLKGAMDLNDDGELTLADLVILIQLLSSIVARQVLTTKEEGEENAK